MRRLDVWIFLGTLLLSLVGHVALIEGLGAAARNAPKRTFRRMEVAVIAPPPPPKPIKIEKPADVPPPPNEPPPPDTRPPKPVFGVTMSSVVGPGSGSGMSVRVGNTLMKEQDKDFTPPDQVRAYKAPVALHKVNTMPRRIGDCKAEYPQEAKALGIEGRVVLKVEILADGSVGDVKVVEGIGHGLDEAAVAALKKCKFTPAIMAGKEVPTE